MKIVLKSLTPVELSHLIQNNTDEKFNYKEAAELLAEHTVKTRNAILELAKSTEIILIKQG